MNLTALRIELGGRAFLTLMLDSEPDREWHIRRRIWSAGPRTGPPPT